MSDSKACIKNKNDIFKARDVQLPQIPDRTISITDYGAIGDGITMNTDAFRKAIDACAAMGGGRVVIPEGLWLTGPIELKSNINLHVEKGAVVMFSKNLSDYPLVLTRFEGLASARCMAPLFARNCENIAITGSGVFDGNGSVWGPKKKSKFTEAQWNKIVNSGGVVDDQPTPHWWPSEQAMKGRLLSKAMGEKIRSIEECQVIHDYLRPVLLNFVECKRILLDGPTFQNSGAWCLHPLLSDHITIRNVSVRNPWNSANGDALDLESCRNVNIYDSVFDAGDDAICIKSGKDKEGRELGRPTEHVSIWNCTVYHGHGGFVVGSEMSGSVRDIRIWDCVFLGTDTGLRFKSTRGRGGVVEDIYIDNIRMKDIGDDAITFNTFYGIKGGPNAAQAPVPVSEETPEFKNIFISNISCSGAQKAISICGLPEMPIHHISFSNVLISAEKGLDCINAENISFVNVDIVPNSSPVFSFKNCRDIKLEGSRCIAKTDVFVKVSGESTERITCKNLYTANAASALVLDDNVKPGSVERI